MPSDDEFARWARGLPDHPLHRNEARAVVAEAKARGLRASWIGPLERKLLYLRGKGAGAPGCAGRRGPGRRRPPLDPRAPPPLTPPAGVGYRHGADSAPEGRPTVADKPSYLGLLNAVANAECRVTRTSPRWADVTPDAEVRALLLTIAAREGEHGMSFAKRINELGFELQPTDDPGFDEKMEIATSSCTDLEKLDALGVLKFASGDEPDVFDNFFRDHSIDIRTGELLGRYIAEERDTLRLLQGCCAELTANATESSAGASDDDRLVSLEDKLDAVCRGVEELRQIVCAQTMPAASA